MKKLTAILLALLLLFLVGCTDSGDSAYDQTFGEINPTPVPSEVSEEPTELTGTLTLSSPYPKEYSILGFYGELFQKEHPGVEIVYDMPEDFDSLVTYMDKMRTAFYSDVGGDVYDMTLYDYQKLAHSGLLKDFYYYMSNDESFNTDDYYTNVWKAMEVDGKLYTLPAFFNYDLIQFNLSVCEKLGFDPAPGDSIDYKQLRDLFREAKDKGYLAEDAHLFANADFHPSYIDTMEMPGRFVNMDSLTANFDSDEFRTYFDDVRSDDIFEVAYHTVVYDTLDDTAFADFASSGRNVAEFKNITTEDVISLNRTVPVKLNASNGNKVFDSVDIISISAFCDQEMLPWEFVKFIIATRDYADTQDLSIHSYKYDVSYNINRKNCYNSIKLIVDEDAAKLVDRINSELNTAAIAQSHEFASYLWDIDHNNPNISAEEAAKELQEKADIYFGEW